MPPIDLGQLNLLMRMLRAGNAEALDGIYLTVGSRMFALARGIVGNPADAEDVLSDSFLKIANGARAYREGTNAYAFVMRIVRNAAFDLLRRKKRRKEENLDAFFSLTDERYSEDRRDEALALEAALGKLNEPERRLIYYRYYLDFSVREIAAETGMSKSTAARTLTLTEEKLRNLLSVGQKEV